MATTQSTATRNKQPIADDAVIGQALDILHRRLRKSGSKITSFGDAMNYLLLYLGERDSEVFAALFLDSKHRVIAFEKLFSGTINQCAVYPREIARRALHHNAATILLAHNHPSGDPTPSRADILLTQRISDVLALIDVGVLDHIIVGRARCAAFSQLGLMGTANTAEDFKVASPSDTVILDRVVKLAAEITSHHERIKTLESLEKPSSREKATLTMTRKGMMRRVRAILGDTQ
jgi:DNA repair protein RadC